MPEEYARRAPKPLRFDKLVGGVTKSLEETQARRQGRRDSDEKIFKDADLAAKGVQQFENQSLETFMQEGVGSVRNEYYNLNQSLKRGEITRSEYTSRVGATQTALSMFANTAKTFDEASKNFILRQGPGKDGAAKAGSDFEQAMAERWTDMADLGNKSLTIDPESGNLYITTRNENGDVISTSDVSRIGNPGNMIDDSYSLMKDVKSTLGTWGDNKTSSVEGRGKVRTIISKKNAPEWDRAVNSKINSILTNNRAVGSVLVDNGAGFYEYYYGGDSPESQEEAILLKIKEKLDIEIQVAEMSGVELTDEQTKEIEDNARDHMILFNTDVTGTFQPEPTPAQVKKARERILQEFNTQADYTETVTAGRAPTKKDKPKSDDTFNMYEEMVDAWKASTGAEGMGALDALTGDDTYFIWEKGGLQAYKPKQYREQDRAGVITYSNVGVKQGSPIKHVDDMFSYFYGETDAKGQGDAQSQGAADKKRYEKSLKNKSSNKMSNEEMQKLIDEASK